MPVPTLPVHLVPFFFLLLLGAAVPDLAAQPAASCTALLAEAEASVPADLPDALLQQLAACLSDEEVTQETAERGYRLLSLAYLSRGAVEAARRALVELLHRVPHYEADPARDPAAYVALVRIVRQQTAAAQPPEVADDAADDTLTQHLVVDTLSLPEPTGTRSMLWLHAQAGPASYGGDRGSSQAGVLHEMARSAGPGFSLGVSYARSPRFSLELLYGAGRFAPLLRVHGQPPAYEPIVPAASSDWIHLLGMGGRLYARPNRHLSPYAQLGFTVAFSRINDQIRAGVGPRASVGADLTLSASFALFVELTGTLLVPDAAMDRAASSRGQDPLAFLGIGLRYRLLRL